MAALQLERLEQREQRQIRRRVADCELTVLALVGRRGRWAIEAQPTQRGERSSQELRVLVVVQQRLARRGRSGRLALARGWRAVTHPLADGEERGW